MTRLRQAVVLIHGVGEQRPMTTLRGFVDAVLGPPRPGRDASYYSKPDTLDETFELRRLVTTDARSRTDFYEFYWAHLMPTAAGNRIASWFFLLMWRRPRDVPGRVRSLWWLSWALFLLACIAGIVAIVDFVHGRPAKGLLEGAPWSLLFAVALISSVLRSYVGDAAVYLSPTPANIAARQEIRSAGVSLLSKLLADEKYDRVIVVGHSLGSVIGYDVIAHCWQRCVDDCRDRVSADWAAGRTVAWEAGALIAADRLTKGLKQGGGLDPAAWRLASRALFDELARNGFGWKVSDFVTLGSPLTHGELLLADDRADFVRRKRERELPCCPPEPEPKGNFSFYHRGVDDRGMSHGIRLPHHAAPFAATGWINLHFGSRWLLWGDLIGGPVAPQFGPGVEDIEVETKVWRGWLAHTHYWSTARSGGASGLARLRQALDLGRRRGAPRERQVGDPGQSVAPNDDGVE